MTTFYRSGFWRTSKHGITHWVEGHEVTRTDWDHYAYINAPTYIARSNLIDSGVGASLASAYVNPNARCPVCDASVFYYQNAHGSRLYFDDLGPPWPKHPCTDTVDFDTGPSTEHIVPSVRSDAQIALIRNWLQIAEIEFENPHFATQNPSAWAPYRLAWREDWRRVSILILSRLSEGKPAQLFLKVRNFPRITRCGEIVFFRRNRISYLDTSAARSIEIQVERLSGHKGFVRTLVNLKVPGDDRDS
jgi:hypothetical protein